jgi:hypothetical protein
MPNMSDEWPPVDSDSKVSRPRARDWALVVVYLGLLCVALALLGIEFVVPIVAGSAMVILPIALVGTLLGRPVAGFLIGMQVAVLVAVLVAVYVMYAIRNAKTFP